MHWDRGISLLVAAMLSLPATHARAQEYLGQMRGADCVSRGGSPDSSITSDDEPDPIRNCWRHHTSGSNVSGSGGNAGSAVVAPSAPAGPSDAAVGLQVGGAVLQFLGQIISNMEQGGDSAPPVNPYIETQKQLDAVAEQERQRVRQEAHDFNERGRREAEAGNTAAAMVSFQQALERAERIKDFDNRDIYRDNMNLMKAYIAYDFGARAWRHGDYSVAKKRFGEALAYARDAHREPLVGKMRAEIDAMAAKVSDPGAKSSSQQNCMFINGEALCN